ncbi:class I SAM-dependent methyltransferase [Candidatus Gottesmanbacteria bacterium]|nr:class I SAM-dependent methyltransferase [Candidatus Gottesmanbacteria bacterium]
MFYNHFNPTPYEGHWLTFRKIPKSCKVLDIGCATGYFAKELKEKRACKVWGIDIDVEALLIAKKYCEKVYRMDLTKAASLPVRKNFFDVILLLDVVEHLPYPSKFLLLLHRYLKSNGVIIVSIPNIAFLSIRLMLLCGKFTYRDTGIMDQTHLRFYTKKTFLKLFWEAKWNLRELDVASGFSQITAIGKYLNYTPKNIQYHITKAFPTLLGYQFIGLFSQ